MGGGQQGQGSGAPVALADLIKQQQQQKIADTLSSSLKDIGRQVATPTPLPQRGAPTQAAPMPQGGGGGGNPLDALLGATGNIFAPPGGQQMGMPMQQGGGAGGRPINEAQLAAILQQLGYGGG